MLRRDRDLSLIYAGQDPLLVNLADTNEERKKGLSYRSSLKDGQGMLFVFEGPDRACMWMKGMNFPLDVYWFSESGRLVSYTKNVTPASYPKVYCPNEKALYMLEVGVGELQELPDLLTLEK